MFDKIDVDDQKEEALQRRRQDLDGFNGRRFNFS
jgi:hypothetical protein